MKSKIDVIFPRRIYSDTNALINNKTKTSRVSEVAIKIFTVIVKENCTNENATKSKKRLPCTSF